MKSLLKNLIRQNVYLDMFEESLVVKRTRVISPLLSDEIEFPRVFQANKWKEQCS